MIGNKTLAAETLGETMTVTVLDKQLRQGAFTSSNIAIPPNPPAKIIGTVLIDIADMEDPTTQITMSLWVSTDGGNTWTSIGGCGWSGGPQAPQKNGVVQTWSCSNTGLPAYAGQLARATFNVEPQKNVGVSVTI